jgi:hypothetical protein
VLATKWRTRAFCGGGLAAVGVVAARLVAVGGGVNLFQQALNGWVSRIRCTYLLNAELTLLTRLTTVSGGFARPPR